MNELSHCTKNLSECEKALSQARKEIKNLDIELYKCEGDKKVKHELIHTLQSEILSLKQQLAEAKKKAKEKVFKDIENEDLFKGIEITIPYVFLKKKHLQVR